METKHDDLYSLAIPLLVFSGLTRIADRTQIQKLVFIVNECGWHVVSDFKFIARGPFSEWLDAQLDSWIGEGVVEEAEESILIGTENEVGFYCYSLTDKGKTFAENVIDSIDEPELIDKTLRHLRTLTNYTEQELEIASSILYVSREEDLDSHSIVERILRFRPDFTETEVRKHLDVLERAKDRTF